MPCLAPLCCSVWGTGCLASASPSLQLFFLSPIIQCCAFAEKAGALVQVKPALQVFHHYSVLDMLESHHSWLSMVGIQAPISSHLEMEGPSLDPYATSRDAGGCASPCCRLFPLLLGLSVPFSGKSPFAFGSRQICPQALLGQTDSRATTSKGFLIVI